MKKIKQLLYIFIIITPMIIEAQSIQINVTTTDEKDITFNSFEEL